MSAVDQWPTAFMKQWVLPISYIVGLTYGGSIISPSKQATSVAFYRGVIVFGAMFDYPVTAVYAFSRLGSYYTDPIIVVPDYPTAGVLLSLKIEP